LDLKTPGGLRSAVQPGKGDDPELVAEAWGRYVQSKTRGNVRDRFDRQGLQQQVPPPVERVAEFGWVGDTGSPESP